MKSSFEVTIKKLKQSWHEVNIKLKRGWNKVKSKLNWSYKLKLNEVKLKV